VKKFLAAAAVVAPVMMIAPAAPASADSVCAPVTIDGQPVCQDVTPVEQAIANAEATALAELDAVLTVVDPFIQPTEWSAQLEADCLEAPGAPTGDVVLVDVVTPDQANPWQCEGTEITVPPFTRVPGTTEHIHVPQVCVTTTNTCAGPVDEDIPTPVDVTELQVCQTPVRIYFSNVDWTWHREYGTSVCSSVSL
jgi:hypothetical protein